MKTNFQMIMDIRDYRPETRGVTSIGEIKMLMNHFGLDKMSLLELQNLRDMVVLMFREWMQDDRSKGEIDEMMSKSDAMQSITAVIDHFKMKAGGEV